ncbi:GD protease, partial [Acromyrmex heyeri]
MAKISILIALLLQFCSIIQGLAPCIDYYTHIVKQGTNEILGEITIQSPKLPPYDLKVGLNTDPSLHTKEPVAELQLARSIQESVQAVQQGKSLLYHVHFPLGQPIPRLTKILFNNQQICPNPRKTETIPTTKEIQLLTSNSTNEELFSMAETNSENPSLSTIENDRRDPSTTTNLSEGTDNNECGISNYTDRKNLLVINGEETKPGQWPWLVALFVVRKDHEFRCCGSVLSTKHILTAAHCLKLNFSSNFDIPPNVLVVALGRFNLRQWRERGTINREVASYTIHPNYTHEDSGDSDLAILTLRTTVEYSLFIKPICLWTGSNNLDEVVNRIGYVVGWGQDEFGNPYTAEPRMARVPIVSEVTCLRSHPIFITLTSERTFCAGLRYQSPCNGDSGSGLVLYDSSTGRYRLRGVVSRSVTGNDFLCDLQRYIVYVDVAKYIPWIQEQISTTTAAVVYRTTSTTVSPSNENTNNECGITSYYTDDTNSKISNGEVTLPGQWPWVVAIYNSINNEFICIGSILTTRHILTVAHCLKKYVDDNTIDPNNLYVAFGEFILYHQWYKTINRDVACYKIHPNYVHTNSDSNLAILILRLNVEYSPFIKPICLWSGSTDLENVVNKIGYVVGWGRDEFGHPNTDERRMARVSIVSQADCLWSDSTFTSLTSNRTFCAGLQNGNNCITNSGSGLVLFDAITRRYKLRGIASRALFGNASFPCDPTKYIVYVDVAKYVPWIQQQISTT